jgi:hypothetical protein
MSEMYGQHRITASGQPGNAETVTAADWPAAGEPSIWQTLDSSSCRPMKSGISAGSIEGTGSADGRSAGVEADVRSPIVTVELSK